MCLPPTIVKKKSLDLLPTPVKKPSPLRKFVRANFKWIVTICVEIAWFTWAFRDPEANFGRFTESTPYVGYYYHMSITMVFGSLVAGATSEGGGAVAFPVMTLALGVPPGLARDFSFSIQSFGMTCASVIIFFLKVPLDYEALIWCSVGGTVGLLVGLVGVAPFLLPSYSKLCFVSLWLSFSVALFRLNTRKERKVYESAKDSDAFILEYKQHLKNDVSVATGDDYVIAIEDYKILKARRKRIATLTIIGVIGGICSSIAGSGLDMAAFSILTLYYRVSEKVATPTSVVLMASNAVVGMLCRLIPIGGAYAAGEEETLWKFVSVCIPIVVVGAPLGAHIPTILSRHQISYVLYFLSTLQFISAYVIVRPWGEPSPHGVGLIVSSAATLIIGTLFFIKAANFGELRDAEIITKEASEISDQESMENSFLEASEKPLENGAIEIIDIST